MRVFWIWATGLVASFTLGATIAVFVFDRTFAITTGVTLACAFACVRLWAKE